MASTYLTADPTTPGASLHPHRDSEEPPKQSLAQGGMGRCPHGEYVEADQPGNGRGAKVVDHTRTVLVGLLIAGYVSYYLASRQRAAFAFWLLVLCTVPFWLQVTVVSGLPPATIAAVIVLPAIIKARPRDRLAMVDRVLIFVIVLDVVTTMLKLSSRYVISAPVLQWVTAYVVGRRLGYACGRHFVSNAVAVAGTAIAVWAIGEYIFHVH